jgi:hypothetical protein
MKPFLTDKKLECKFHKETWDSFSYEQKREICRICDRIMPQALERHVINFQHSFWFFRKWYLVLLFGKDTRQEFRSKELSYSQTFVRKIGMFFFITILFLGAFAFLFLLFYLIKSVLGIDFFPEKHLLDFLL